jgi:uncharacterized protein
MEIEEVVAKIRSVQLELAQKAPRDFCRYLYSEINKDNRLNVIIGARGVGKTTLLLQLYRDLIIKGDKVLYFGADSSYVASLSLIEIGEYFYQHGGEILLIDEIHHYSNWQQEIKTLYDSYPDLKVVVTGSSSLNIIFGQFDLSRRSRIYPLWGLSFREFVNLKLGTKLETIKLSQVFNKHQKHALSTKGEVEKKNSKIQQLFKQYLTFGYYPYFIEGEDDFLPKLKNAVEKVLYEDIPVLFNLRSDSISKIKQILSLVATSSPFVVNIERLSRILYVSKPSVYQYLDVLEKANLNLGVKQKLSGYASARKPEKLYLDNPNLYPLLAAKRIDSDLVGALRESFFANQVSKVAKLNADKKVDFLVEGKRKVEVGGKSKQLKDETIWLAKDGIEIGSNRSIPLYLFGFLY